MAVKKNVMKLIVCFSLIIGMVSFDVSSKIAQAALNDGAYLVSRTTYYINPETGDTEDGGSNTALGESMIESVLNPKVLVEQVNGKTYVTLGIGLMSSVSNVSIEVQTKKGGSYKKANITKTGSSIMSGDTCNHYRFEVISTDYYISPSLYVTPMGREVQFFVKLDMNSAVAGTGDYVAEMVGSVSNEVDTEDTNVSNDETEGTTNTGSSTSSNESDSEQDSSSDSSTSDEAQANESSSSSITPSNSISLDSASTEDTTSESIPSSDNNQAQAEENVTEVESEEETLEEEVVIGAVVDVETRFEEAEGITVHSVSNEEEIVEITNEETHQRIAVWDVVALSVLVISCIGIGDFIGRKRMEKRNETK